MSSSRVPEPPGSATKPSASCSMSALRSCIELDDAQVGQPRWPTSRATSDAGITPITSPPAASAASASVPMKPTARRRRPARPRAGPGGRPSSPRRRVRPARAGTRRAEHAHAPQGSHHAAAGRPGLGQPEESLTSHHPASTPTRPRAGADLPHPAAALAELGVRDAGGAVAARLAEHALQAHPRGLLALADLGQARLRAAQPPREVVAQGLELPSSSRRAPRRRSGRSPGRSRSRRRREGRQDDVRSRRRGRRPDGAAPGGRSPRRRRGRRSGRRRDGGGQADGGGPRMDLLGAT